MTEVAKHSEKEGTDLAATYPAHICCNLGEPVLARIPAYAAA